MKASSLLSSRIVKAAGLMILLGVFGAFTPDWSDIHNDRSRPRSFAEVTETSCGQAIGTHFIDVNSCGASQFAITWPNGISELPVIVRPNHCQMISEPDFNNGMAGFVVGSCCGQCTRQYRHSWFMDCTAPYTPLQPTCEMRQNMLMYDASCGGCDLTQDRYDELMGSAVIGSSSSSSSSESSSSSTSSYSSSSSDSSSYSSSDSSYSSSEYYQ